MVPKHLVSLYPLETLNGRWRTPSCYHVSPAHHYGCRGVMASYYVVITSWFAVENEETHGWRIKLERRVPAIYMWHLLLEWEHRPLSASFRTFWRLHCRLAEDFWSKCQESPFRCWILHDNFLLFMSLPSYVEIPWLVGEAVHAYWRDFLTPSKTAQRKGLQKEVLTLASLHDLTLHMTMITYPWNFFE